MIIGRWLDADGAAEHLGIRVDQLKKWTQTGKVPAPSYQLGPKRPRWDRDALDAAMQAAFADKASLDPAVATDAFVEEMLGSESRSGRQT